jgi:hypothetical protein
VDQARLFTLYTDKRAVWVCFGHLCCEARDCVVKLDADFFALFLRLILDHIADELVLNGKEVKRLNYHI